MNPNRFRAKVISGRGRGRDLGFPTYNMDLQNVPKTLEEGIYAGSAEIDGKVFPAAMHYGPRPVFRDSKAFEVHLIDVTPETDPEEMIIDIKKRLRDVQDFPSVEEMLKQITHDVDTTRAIMRRDEGIR